MFCEEWKRWKILRICLLCNYLSINVSCPSDLHYHFTAFPQSWLSIIDVNDCFWGRRLLRLLTESCGFASYQKCLRRCLVHHELIENICGTNVWINNLQILIYPCLEITKKSKQTNNRIGMGCVEKILVIIFHFFTLY